MVCNDKDVLERLEKLEIKLAWHEDTIDTLNKVIVDMRSVLDLQQKQLQHLYRKINSNNELQDNEHFYPINEKPPHY